MMSHKGMQEIDLAGMIGGTEERVETVWRERRAEKEAVVSVLHVPPEEDSGEGKESLSAVVETIRR